jgi:hypothetical protein
MNEITKNNKLIAEFMNVTPKMQSPELYSLNDAPFFYCTETTEEKCLIAWAKYSKYNSSWDWLMPVVEKIEKMQYITDEVNICWDSVGGKYHTEITNASRDTFEIIRMYADTKIESTLLAVVEFIKWYNKTKIK